MPVVGILFMPHPPILLPSIGEGRENEAVETLRGIEQINALADSLEFDSVLCFSPHGPMFGEAVCAVDFDEYSEGLKSFGVRKGLKWERDNELMRHITDALTGKWPFVRMDKNAAAQYGVRAAFDHGAEVPLTLVRALHNKPLVYMTPGFLNRPTLYAAGASMGAALRGFEKNVLVLASGDLAHCHGKGPYPFAPEGPEYDGKIRDALAKGDRWAFINMPDDFVEKAQQCAIQPFVFALGLIDGMRAKFKVHSCEAPFGVGYLAASAILTGESERSLVNEDMKVSGDEFIALAYETIKTFVNTGETLSFSEYSVNASCSEEFTRRVTKERTGAFVSMHKYGELRGCIGTIQPTQDCLADEIIYCAIQAASKDPRFVPLMQSELLEIDVKVDVLSTPERVESEEQLDEKKYGVIVENGHRRGLLLPDLDGVDSVQHQIMIARQKAGIMPDKPVKLSRFTVERHE